MISQTSEYALRAIVWLAGHPQTPLTTQQIAAATRVPAGYLSKVLQSLGKAGLVHSQRGLHGGFALTRKPEKLTVLDVVTAVDPLPRIRRCPLGLRGHGKRLCPLHRRLDDAVAMLEAYFKETTIAALLNDPSAPLPGPLCDLPRRALPEGVSAGPLA